MFDYIQEIKNFDLELFHFLRADWLWALVAVGFIVLLVFFSSRENKKWKEVIAPALRPFMFTKEQNSALGPPLITFTLFMSLGIIGLAGPTWSKVEVPGSKSEAVVMIAMDVSLSMLAEDIQPNRLERAKFKIKDFLKANPGSRVSLFAYSGTVHTVVPMCKDYNLLTHHLESLHPSIMPIQGTNLEMMVEMADSSLRNILAPSTLLLVTDAIEMDNIDILFDFVDNSPHQIEILTMATPQGAEIRKNKKSTPVRDNEGNVVISRLNTDVLFKLQEHKKININTLTLDNSDMEELSKNIRQNLDYQHNDEESEEQWRDMGFLFVIVLALFIPLWFRKGWMIQYAWLPFLFIFFPSCNETNTWEDLWYTKDYQGQILYQSENFEEAGNTYTSNFHQGVAYYKGGNYDAAAQSFKKDSSANAYFNLSLAYTQMGEYDKALDAITLANEKNPNNETFQKALNETYKTIGIIDSLRKSGNPILLEQEQEKKKGELKEIKPVTEDEELTSDTEVEELPEDGERVTDEIETDQRKAKELEEVPEDFQSGGGENSPQNILLREISAEPSEFLRRRFKYQQKKYYQNKKEIDQKW